MKCPHCGSEMRFILNGWADYDNDTGPRHAQCEKCGLRYFYGKWYMPKKKNLINLNILKVEEIGDKDEL